MISTGLIITIVSVVTISAVTEELDSIYRDSKILKTLKAIEISTMGAIAIGLTVKTVKIIKTTFGG